LRIQKGLFSKSLFCGVRGEALTDAFLTYGGSRMFFLFYVTFFEMQYMTGTPVIIYFSFLCYFLCTKKVTKEGV